MVNVIAYPLSIQSDGSFGKIEDMSEPHIAQEIALLILTEPGERPLVPEYGMESTEDHESISELELNSKLEMFEVPAVVKRVWKSPGLEEPIQITVEFEPIQRESFRTSTAMNFLDPITQPHQTVELS